MKNLIKLAQEVVDQADDTGCDDDLTVTSKSAVDKLAKHLRALAKKEARKG